MTEDYEAYREALHLVAEIEDLLAAEAEAIKQANQAIGKYNKLLKRHQEYKAWLLAYEPE